MCLWPKYVCVCGPSVFVAKVCVCLWPKYVCVCGKSMCVFVAKV